MCRCRYPTLPIAELQRHQAPVNALSWAPHSSAHICTAGDDSQVRAACVGCAVRVCVDSGLLTVACPVLVNRASNVTPVNCA